MSMQEAWHDYRTKVVPPTASPVQVIECRRAFYAGAGALMGEVCAMLSPGPGCTREDEDQMKQLFQEMQAFARSVKEGLDTEA